MVCGILVTLVCPIMSIIQNIQFGFVVSSSIAGGPNQKDKFKVIFVCLAEQTNQKNDLELVILTRIENK